jgi:uncharacterized protein
MRSHPTFKRSQAQEVTMTVMTMNPPGTFCWMELGTTDASQARDFYAKLFGWEVVAAPMGPDFTYYTFRVGGKDVAAMYQLMPDQLKMGVPPHWLSYVAVTDADAAAARATALGGKVVMGPHDAAEHGRLAIITDPQGAVFAVWQAKNNPGVGLRGEPGSIVWNELMSTDLAGGTAFYAKLFDWTTKVMPMPGMDYTIFEREGTGVGGGMAITPEMGPMPSHWLPYFAVSDCDGTTALAATLGARVMQPPMEIPGAGRFSVMVDPAGAAFAILKPMPRP